MKRERERERERESKTAQMKKKWNKRGEREMDYLFRLVVDSAVGGSQFK